MRVSPVRCGTCDRIRGVGGVNDSRARGRNDCESVRRPGVQVWVVGSHRVTVAVSEVLLYQPLERANHVAKGLSFLRYPAVSTIEHVLCH